MVSAFSTRLKENKNLPFPGIDNVVETSREVSAAKFPTTIRFDREQKHLSADKFFTSAIALNRLINEKKYNKSVYLKCAVLMHYFTLLQP